MNIKGIALSSLCWTPSWLPNSIYLHLDFYLLTEKYKRHSIVMCWTPLLKSWLAFRDQTFKYFNHRGWRTSQKWMHISLPNIRIKYQHMHKIPAYTLIHWINALNIICMFASLSTCISTVQQMLNMISHCKQWPTKIPNMLWIAKI